MKQTIITILVLVFTISSIYADVFKIRLIENEKGYMEVQMKCIDADSLPSTSTPISGFTFQIRWLVSLSADIDILCSSNPYNLADGFGAIQTTGSYHWRTYAAASTPFNCPTNWVINEWETITSFIVTIGSGTGDFEIAPNGWVAQGLNWQIEDPVHFYHPGVISGITNYSYPTVVYNLVWTGADGTYPTYWDVAANWTTTCGGTGSIPNTGDNCFIPFVTSGNYPENIGDVAGFGKHQPICDYLRIASGAMLNIDDEDYANVQAIYTVNNDLLNYGTVTIVPNGQLTVNGSTYIDGAAGLTVQADNTGVGSFIDNGTITYGASGSARVQTYLHNGATAGSFWIHLVGPTVDITGSPGVTLGDFDLAALQTYAYQWDETVPSNQGWVNVYNPATAINTGTGLALSTNDAADHTLEMVGELLTGSVTTPLTYSNNHLMLISNPYPSAIDFDAFQPDNSDIINQFWIWDASIGNYITRSGGVGNQRYIQVGQGFFVETISGALYADFANTQRSHSTDPFRDVQINTLHVTVEGGSMGYKDNAWIHFSENKEVTNGYDQNFDGEKWASYYEDATSIWTITEDDQALQVNQLPLEQLLRNATSVPMSFVCGYDDEYTLHFEGVESFDNGAEIWLEDIKTGGGWVSLNDNPDYTFTASPEDDQNRFIIHFFNVTGTDQHMVLDPIQIYSHGNYAYVVNLGDEPVKQVSVYNMSGSQVLSIKVPDQKVNKIWVDNKLAYYIVRVVTDEKVYTKKVLISYY